MPRAQVLKALREGRVLPASHPVTEPVVGVR